MAERSKTTRPQDCPGAKPAVVERGRAPNEIWESQELLQGIVDSAMEAIICVDERHRIRVFNSAAEHMFGYKSSNVLGESLDRLIPPQFRGVHSSHIAKFGATGITKRSMQSPGTLTALRADGQEFPIEATISQVSVPAGKAFTVILRDISLRKEAEEKLRVSEEKFAKAFASNPAAIVITRLDDGVILDVNETWVALIGCSRAEAIGSSTEQMNIWPTRESADHFVQEIRAKGSLRGWEQAFCKKSGDLFVAQLSAQILTMGTAQVVISTLVDITERKKAERALAEKARLLDLSYDAILVRDAQDRIVYWNEGACQAYGYTREEALGRSPHELLRTEFSQPLAEILESLQRKGYWTGELVHTHKTGRKLTVSSRWSLDRDVNGIPTAILETNSDITGAKLAQEALIRSEKLASVGRMAATVSHEINNPLAVIVNSVFLATLDKNLSDESRQALATAEQELERVAQLTRQTLGFYRENTAPEAVDLASLVENVIAMYRPKIVDRKISVTFEHHASPPMRAVAGEIRQVVSNLVANSIDASPLGGRIIVRTRSITLKDDRFVRLTFADTGEGISPENLSHVFEPFFTTKQSVGTGLGLWVSSQIIARHGGTLRVHSRIHRGTVFCIFLPISSPLDASQSGDRE